MGEFSFPDIRNYYKKNEDGVQVQSNWLKGQNKEVRTITTHMKKSIYSRRSIVDQWRNDNISISTGGAMNPKE